VNFLKRLRNHKVLRYLSPASAGRRAAGGGDRRVVTVDLGPIARQKAEIEGSRNPIERPMHIGR
jgi:hypothetical protein